MSDTRDKVWQSYQRCTEDYEFLHDFYFNFIAASPEISRYFANTDMDHQTIVLRASLDMMLGSPKQAQGRQDLETVAKVHSRTGLGIPPRLYDAWLESLISTVRSYDAAFDTDLEQAWRDALAPGISHMKAAY